ncbi:MAG: GNAT family N-acetyltransferase [Thiogranum sp.]|jgi:ribosomal protein S18 acetylase RimI-like enzyme|nr:GNAT family N-acetyltransferase [Thiogranum sp.]
MSVRIEAADLDNRRHQGQVVALLDLYSRDAMGNGEPLPEATRAALISGLRRHPASLVLLAWQAQRCVGLCICFEGFSTFQAKPLLNIHDLVVDPAHRNLGVGRALLAAVEAAARERDCCRITLEVRADNGAAQHLYRGVGFRESDPVMHFWHKCLQPSD